MSVLTKKNIEARQFLTSVFSSSFPKSFRCLQDMALAGSKAYANNGKRAWFGLGRDMTLETMRSFTDSIVMLVLALHQEEFINLPASKGIAEVDQVNSVASLFFTAYPNWQDAEAAWAAVADNTVIPMLQKLGYRQP